MKPVHDSVLLRGLGALAITVGVVSCMPRTHDSPTCETLVLLYPERPDADGRRMVAVFAKDLAERLPDACFTVEQIDVDISDPGLEKTLRSREGTVPWAVLAGNDVVAKAAVKVYPKVPVLFYSHTDPLQDGLAESLAWPGGYATGATTYIPLLAKRIELLREVVPNLTRVGFIDDYPSYATSDWEELTRQVALLSDVQIELAMPASWDGLPNVIAMVSPRVQAWVVPMGRLPFSDPKRMTELLSATGKPAIYAARYMVEAGGLMAYYADTERQFDVWIDAIQLLERGSFVGEIPIERAKTFRFVLNADIAAKFDVSPTLLERADVVVRTSK